MKKLASLLLALTLCLGLCILALAAEGEPPIPVEQGVKDISWTSNLYKEYDLEEQDLEVKDDTILWRGETISFPVVAYTATTKDEVFTVKNTMTQDDGSYIWIFGYGYEQMSNGTYCMGGAGDDMYFYKGQGLVRWDEQPEDPYHIKAGESVTFKLPLDQYKSGAYFEVHVAIYLAKYDYNFEVYSTFRVNEEKVAAAKAAKNTPSTGKFKDVPDNSPFKEAINWAVDQKIANGKTATTFAPNEYCSIRHILTFLWRGNGRPGDNGNESAAVTAWAKKMGMADVESNLCARSTAVLYMWKAAGSPEPTKTASFTDVPANASYAKAVSWAVEKGITSGTTAATFSPERNCTRGQIVTFLYRASK